MSTAIEGIRPSQSHYRPAAQEAVWRTWITKGHAREHRNGRRRVQALKCVSIAILLAAAILRPSIAPFDELIRVVVTLAAIVVMFQTFQAGRYAFAMIFGALALLLNPLFPVAFSTNWPRILLLASTVPFALSLTGRNTK